MFLLHLNLILIDNNYKIDIETLDIMFVYNYLIENHLIIKLTIF